MLKHYKERMTTKEPQQSSNNSGEERESLIMHIMSIPDP